MFKLTCIAVFVIFSFLNFHRLFAQQSPESLIPELASQLNVWRLQEGLGPLVYSPKLEAMAALQADYLISLESIPLGGAMHTGAKGEDARARSQFEQFAWPTYGHEQKISVTEIAAIGSIKSAITFWQNSDLHRRSVTNPNYREVGIAVREEDDDMLFIVVLGSRPNVLPVLVDLETNLMHLTNEMNEWAGPWIHYVMRYRILNADQQVIQEWQDWQRDVPVPAGLDLTQTFYVEFEDAQEYRVTSEVLLNLAWSSIPASDDATAAPGVALLATNTPGGGAANSGGGLRFATNTAVPTITQTPLPSATPTWTPTPTPNSVLLTYFPRVFNVIPQSARVNLAGLSFTGNGRTFETQRWEDVANDLNVGALSSGNCLQVVVSPAGSFDTPNGCSYIRSQIVLSEAQTFWTAGSFDVLKNGEVLATCSTEAGACEIVLPS